MNKIKTGILLFVFLFIHYHSQAQAPLTTAIGANILESTFQFQTQSGEYYTSNGNNTSLLSLDISYLHLSADRLGFGLNLLVNMFSNNGNKNTTFSLGPEMKYFFESESPTIPYIGIGAGYLLYKSNEDKMNGLRINPSLGIAFERKKLLVLVETGLLLDRIEGSKGHNFYLAFGVAAAFPPKIQIPID